MRLIIVHGFMNNIYHNSSYMINIDHCMKACWSCSATVDHCHERLLILHDHWYTTLLIMYHNCWSCHERPLIIHEKLIIAMKACWSCITTVDHLSYRDHYKKACQHFQLQQSALLFLKADFTQLLAERLFLTLICLVYLFQLR